MKNTDKLSKAEGTYTSAANMTATVVYTDKDGKAQSMNIDLGNVTNVKTGLKLSTVMKALKGNDTLSQMFDFTDDGNITNKTAGLNANATNGTGGQPKITSIILSGKKADGTALSETEIGAPTLTAGTASKVGKDATAVLAGTAQAGDFVMIDGMKYTFVKGADGSDGATFGSADALKAAAAKNGITIRNAVDGHWAVNTVQKGGTALTLQIGDTGDDFNQLNVSIKDTHTTALGISDIDIGTQAGAKAAVDKIKAAINTVSSIRGTLGATQNRLDHTINNLSVMTENIQDAESTIRDTDVADEMMAYTKNNILIQSAQAMLAQANQVPQGVLQLLQ